MDNEQLTRGALVVLAANAVCLAAIVLVVAVWRSRQPMTAARMRQTLLNQPVTLASQPPFDTLPMMLSMLDDLNLPVSQERLVQAVLVGWANKGWLCLRMTPKKKLKSFGDELQPTLVFLQQRQMPGGGAEGILYQLLADWADETNTIQQSELYNLARQTPGPVENCLEQFWLEGKHALRSFGAVYPEKKHRRFGFLDERRTIYTPRGLRAAGSLLGYRKWLTQTQFFTEEQRQNAILFGLLPDAQTDVEHMAAQLAHVLVTAAHAGQNAKG